MEQVRQLLPLATWLGTLVLAIVLFTALGSGPLAAPPLMEPAAWSDWADSREPVEATVAVLRLLVLATAWYLVGVTTIGAIARLARLASLVRVADALSIPVVRRVVQTSLGVGLATAVVASATAAPVLRMESPASHVATDTATEDPTMRVLTDAPTMRPVDRIDTPDLPGMRPLAPATPPPVGDLPLPDAPRVGRTGPIDTATDSEEATWKVRTGDHFWGIAASHLQDQFGATPSDADVAAYWQRLIDFNRDRLADPDNPDLIYPGQEFILPPTEAA